MLLYYAEALIFLIKLKSYTKNLTDFHAVFLI
jgi:hypothetical protein